MILAGIDIGTNSIRLLIAETVLTCFGYCTRTHYHPPWQRPRPYRQSLSDAMMRSFSALGEFQENIRRFSATQTSAIGTSALRNASNAFEFIKEAHKRTGINISVISGEDEARLTLLGVRAALQGPERRETDLLGSAMVIDIGGGSTEFIVTIAAGNSYRAATWRGVSC